MLLLSLVVFWGGVGVDGDADVGVYAGADGSVSDHVGVGVIACVGDVGDADGVGVGVGGDVVVVYVGVCCVDVGVCVDGVGDAGMCYCGGVCRWCRWCCWC